MNENMNDVMMKAYDKLAKYSNELEDKIDKAIKYINGHKEYLKRLDEQGAYYSTIEVRMCDEMIHILKGEE